MVNFINPAVGICCVHYIEQKDCTAGLHAIGVREIPYTTQLVRYTKLYRAYRAALSYSMVWPTIPYQQILCLISNVYCIFFCLFTCHIVLYLEWKCSLTSLIILLSINPHPCYSCHLTVKIMFTAWSKNEKFSNQCNLI